MVMVSEKREADVRYIEELLEEIGLPELFLTFPATDEEGNETPLSLPLNPELLNFLIKNEKVLKRQIKRDGSIRVVPSSSRKQNLQPLYYTYHPEHGPGIVVPDKNNELLLYYMKWFSGGASLMSPLGVLKLRVQGFINKWLSWNRPSENAQEKIKDQDEQELSQTRFIRFSDEPQDPAFQEAQLLLEFLGMPPMIYMEFSSDDGAQRDDPQVSAEKLLARLKPMKREIISQLNEDGYIRELESGYGSFDPLYFCYHEEYKFGIIFKCPHGLRLAFLENMNSVSPGD